MEADGRRGAESRRLRALSRDACVAAAVAGGRLAGDLVAVHARALTIRRADGELWSVVAAEAGDAPATLVVELPQGSAFAALGLRVGDRAWQPGRRPGEPDWREGEAQPASEPTPVSHQDGSSGGDPDRRTEGASRSGAEAGPRRPLAADTAMLVLGSAVLVDLSGALLWQAAPRPTSPRPGAWRRLAGAMARCQPRGGLAALAPHVAALAAGGPPPAGLDALCARAWPPLAALAVAWRNLDAPAVAAAAGGLAGLGPGLTPAGDDLLVGLLAAYRWGRARPLAVAEAALLDACGRACEGRTTALSLARLRYAVRGLLDARCEAVLVSLWQEKPPPWSTERHAALGGAADGLALGAAVDRAWTIGHSSGADTLTGMVLGLILAEGAPLGPG